MAFLWHNTSKYLDVNILQNGKGVIWMETLQNIRLFFQDQVLGMKWLNGAIGRLLA